MGAGGIPGGDQSHTRRQLTVAQAADALGVTVDAIRSRIKRGTIEHVRESGRVYVILGDDQDAPNTDQGTDQVSDQGGGQGSRDELLEELRDRVRYLEEANSENRRIIAALTSRIPQLEPPRDEHQGEPQASEPVAEDIGRGDVPPEPQEPSRQRSWWRRFFGFE